ncbi:uncharacterized protein LOC124282366 [Haliotis rubra]|uniref:uncharacterized protein LOC124282366 n=1 Tax=Haliotis rubra TaxID=36100 RepID=UPI001EE5671F|nr:uncharacterized protein LOC124282366 [Haliotis rubra]
MLVSPLVPLSMVWLNQKSSLSNCLSETKTHPMDTTEDGSDPSYLYVSHLKKDHTCQIQKTKQARENEKSNNKEKCFDVKKHPLVAVLVLSMCVNITLGVVLVMSVARHGMSQNSGLEVLDSSEDLSSSVCVLCASLGFNVQDGVVNGRKDIVVRSMPDHNTFCCLKNSDHLQKLITVFSAQFRYYNRTSIDTTPVLTSPLQIQHGAHLFLESGFLKEHKLVWTTDLGYGCAYIGHGVKLVDGRIQIKEDGTYFLYSFFTLKTRETTSESRNALHTVTRYNPSLPQLQNQLLLFRKHNLARESKRFATTYLGASLVLRKGDEVWVNVEPVSSVYAYSPSNYFGLFKLDN